MSNSLSEKHLASLWIFQIEVEILPASPAYKGAPSVHRALAIAKGDTIESAKDAVIKFCALRHIATIRQSSYANAKDDTDRKDPGLESILALAHVHGVYLEIAGLGAVPLNN